MIRCDAVTFLLGALVLLVLPLKWILSALTAALIHEFCHIFALWLLKERIHILQVSFRGCTIDTGNMADWKQVCSIVAGPLGSLSLLFLRRKLPLIAVCGLFHGLYNLLPMLPLDGGRLLRLVLSRICPQYADRLLFISGILCRLLLCLFALHFLFLQKTLPL